MGIHGDKSQQERDWVLNGKLASLRRCWFLCTAHLLQDAKHILQLVFAEFKFGKAPILIATDVASRGLGQYPP